MEMEDAFICSICLEVANNAVETSCCHHVFCETCLSRMLGRECPQCRATFQVLVSHIARRIIGNMPVACIYKKCGQTLTRSTAKDHERLCKYRIYICPAVGCSFQSEKQGYIKHLFKDHSETIAENAELCFQREGAAAAATPNYHSDDVVAIKKNSGGRDSRIGETGKYYCEGSLGKYTCDCCDGNCGPGNGCNCLPCMKLDVASRKLPRHFYVNREGAICRKSSETGLFYCGRMVMSRNMNCDGYCGPTNGPHCRACEIMQYQCDTRYIGLW